MLWNLVSSPIPQIKDLSELLVSCSRDLLLIPSHLLKTEEHWEIKNYGAEDNEKAELWQ